MSNFSPKLQDSTEDQLWQLINQSKIKIMKTNKKIDKVVYELYGLTEEEIKIVENE